MSVLRDPLGIALAWTLVLALAKLSGFAPDLSWHWVFGAVYVLGAAGGLVLLIAAHYKARGRG